MTERISEAMVEAAQEAAHREGAFLGEDMVRYMLEAALSAARASAQMEGMVMVSREPSEAMTRAAIDAIPMDKYMQIGSRLSNVTLSTDECAIIYRAMLAVALRESLPPAEGEK